MELNLIYPMVYYTYLMIFLVLKITKTINNLEYLRGRKISTKVDTYRYYQFEG